MLGGLVRGTPTMHVPSNWIAVATVVLLGIGILTGVKNMGQKDPS